MKLGKLISEQKEIIGVNTVKFKDAYVDVDKLLLCEKAYQITHAKAYVLLRHCVLCGNIGR